MRGLTGVVLASLVLGGCAELNDSLVRSWFKDRELGDRVSSQIREGLERRQAVPQPELPKRPAPAFLDEG